MARITEKALDRKRRGTIHKDDDVHGVIEFTGPACWTDAIMDYFNDDDFFDLSTGTPSANITWREFTGITSPKKVGDVVVLPITCFSPGIETMGAGDDDDPMAMVKHYFDGESDSQPQQSIQFWHILVFVFLQLAMFARLLILDLLNRDVEAGE